ncbi:MAG: TolC family protein [Balneolaceae bacterium]|nr:TolC family protein [Balneolaceae bacterium]
MKFASEKFLVVLFAGLFLNCNIYAQDTLSVDRAVQIGMENNFSIRIARNESELAVNNNSLGNAGFLPSLSATGSRIYRNENNSQEFAAQSGIPNQTTNNAKSNSTNASASLSWTIFDGLKMFTTREKLEELQKLSQEQLQLSIENNVAQIITAYHDVIRQQKIYDVLQNTVEISEERIDIAETQLDLGSRSEYDLLQARTDLNADRAAVIRQEVRLNNAKVNLNEVLGRDTNIEFSVYPTISINEDLAYAELLQQAMSNNINLAIERTNQDVAELQIDEIQAERFPEIDLSTGYGYSRLESDAGFLALTETDGFNYGVTARWSLFDGFNVNRRIQNAKIQLKNQQLALEQQEQAVEGSLARQFKSYLNSLKLVKLEAENLTFAEQSLEIALERFRLGSINSIELREVQRTLINAESRLIQARFEAKVAETELLRLGGSVANAVN